MEGLLDREEALRERERKSHADREAALQSQVDQLLHYLAQSQLPHPKSPLLLGTIPQSSGVPHPHSPNSRRLEQMAADMAAHPSAANEPRGTFDEGDLSSSASEAVLQAMNFVKEGYDILEDMDLTMPSRSRRSVSDGDASSGSDSDSGESATSPVATVGPQSGSALPSLTPKPPSANGVPAGAAPLATSPPPGTPVPPMPIEPPSASSPQQGTLSQAAVPPLHDARSAERRSNAGVPSPAASSSDAPAYKGPVEVAKAPHDGPPPRLAKGDDDIFWVSVLHVCALPELIANSSIKCL
jgi:hypothetical protein